MPQKNVQRYISALQRRELRILTELVADPEVADAIEHESVEVVCFRLMAAATRVIREDRRTGPDTYQDNHAGDLGELASHFLYELIPFSSIVTHTIRQKQRAENAGHYLEITDERIRGILGYPTLRSYDRNYWDSQPPIKMWFDSSDEPHFDLTPRCLGFYHGKGNLEDNCREAEAYLKSRRPNTQQQQECHSHPQT